MYQKQPGVFMADWWDADGRRHRKQFSNAKSASEHEHRETALAHAERASREMKLARRGSVTVKSEKTDSVTIEPAKGKLGVMIPAMGAVATTFVAGVEAVRKGISTPIGSVTQMGTIRLANAPMAARRRSRSSFRWPGLNDLVFTGWDIFEDDMTQRLATPACWSAICWTKSKAD